MCHSKKSPPPEAHDRRGKKIQTRSISSMMKLIKQEEEVEREREIKPPSAKKPPLKLKRWDRKSRNRRRKPKYLSLRSSRFSAPNDVVPSAATETDSKVTTAIATSTATTRRGQQLNLFPLHPEVTAAEADHQSDDNVALLFESDGGATLHGLLTSADTATSTTTSTMSSDHDQVEESNYGYHRRRSDVDIVQTAMRRSGGDRSVEKWVCYSELVKEEVQLTGTTTRKEKERKEKKRKRVRGKRKRERERKEKKQKKIFFFKVASEAPFLDFLSFFIFKESIFLGLREGASLAPLLGL